MEIIYDLMIEKSINPEVIFNMDSSDFREMLEHLYNKVTKTKYLTDEQRDMIERTKKGL